MADTILNTALTQVLPASAKVLVFAGGSLAILPDGAEYPAGLVQFPISKFTFTPKVESDKKYGIDPATKIKKIIRTWVKSVEFSAKASSAEARNPFVATLAAAGYIHGKFKLMAKDQADAANKAALVLGEFTGTITLDGDYSADELASPDVGYAMEIEGIPAFNFDAAIGPA